MKNEQFSNESVAELLRTIAGAYEIKNENRFKIIAYERAADSVEHLSRELHDLWQEDKLNQVPGLGESIRGSLDEYFKTGKVKHFDSILKDIPPPVFELMKVPGIGPKKAYKLAEALHLKNSKTFIAEITEAAKRNIIAELPTFGKKSQDVIIESLGVYEKHSSQAKRMALPVAYSIAEKVMEYLKEIPSIKRVDALGSLRRMVSTIGDVDIAVGIQGSEDKAIIEHFLKYPGKLKVENAGDNKASIIVSPNVRVDLRVQDVKNYGSMLQYFTGSKSHNIKLREFALKKRLSLSEFGIKKVEKGKETAKTAHPDHSGAKPFPDEESFYGYLGIQYVPPELREGTNEVELAKEHKLPDLVETSDMKGDMHLHSSYNLHPSHDTGADTYQELLDEAHKYQYEYLGLTDHNPKQSGQSEKEIVEIMKKRYEFIHKTCASHKVNFFIGLETDILPDGSLALPEGAYKYIDYQVASVHSVFNMNKDDMTKRVLKALASPKVKIFGHPTGRLLGKREGYELDWDKIFRFVKDKDIAIEINSWTQRLDLPDSLVREAREYGIKFTIDTDSHAKDQMANMKYGVSVARRGWLTKHDIINTGSYKDMKKWILGGDKR